MDFEQVRCIRCEKTRDRKTCGRYAYGRIRYEDRDGAQWGSANACSFCRRKQEGHRRPGKATSPVSIGKRAELRVADWLRGNGYLDARAIGGAGRPDVLFTDEHGMSRSVEVKKAIAAYGGKCWQTHPVSPRRRDDDFVAIVLPNDSVILCSMIDHLALCSPSGKRAITDLVREAQELPQAKGKAS